MCDRGFIGGLYCKIFSFHHVKQHLVPYPIHFEETLCGFVLHSISSITRTRSVFAWNHVNIFYHKRIKRKIEWTLNWQLKQEIRFTSKNQVNKTSSKVNKHHPPFPGISMFVRCTLYTDSHILQYWVSHILMLSTLLFNQVLIVSNDTYHLKCMLYFALHRRTSSICPIARCPCVEALFCEWTMNWMSIVCCHQHCHFFLSTKKKFLSCSVNM